VVTTDPQSTHPEIPQLRGLQLHLAALRERTTALHERAGLVARHSQEVRDTVSVSGRRRAAELHEVQRQLAGVQAELEGLHTAMRTRAVIEQAKGMLMAARKITDDEAFAVLVNLSQTTHRKLVDVASLLVRTWSTEADGEP
jgi:glycine cleavage system pyridoxal-binding protein P